VILDRLETLLESFSQEMRALMLDAMKTERRTVVNEIAQKAEKEKSKKRKKG
jgi:hypothetical protein